MATFKFTGGVSAFKGKLVSSMVVRGYAPDFAARTSRQLEGFGSYGLPESHAASFALFPYASPPGRNPEAVHPNRATSA
ncbi:MULTISPECIES: hypothetical protein [unclassified Paracoccus (in: a-proteobacteria)]|uniref:hypothetical protein n=1 Tax=unclassified Paracoccus (in: a-proteobacteria) TaxID=2688777 RepID=UPI00190AF592|nr:hypothetical protein [Paracoccus sp. MC1862]QQO45352.1 hypothetical protein JGR78_03045 [Paracoccus sp. MC1862]